MLEKVETSVIRTDMHVQTTSVRFLIVHLGRGKVMLKFLCVYKIELTTVVFHEIRKYYT